MLGNQGIEHGKLFWTFDVACIVMHESAGEV